MTERLYYTDSYQTQFSGTVLDVREQNGARAVQLDRSAFYPASGGQPCDTGTLAGAWGRAPVADVGAEDGAVWHLLAAGAPAPAPGDAVQGEIDWPRRFDHMQQHSGQHLLSQVFERLYEFSTASVHIGAQECTLDLDAPAVEPGQLAAAEELANAQAAAALPIRAYFVDEAGLADLHLRRPPKVAGTVRIVEIERYDYSACGGTHTRSTAEVAPVKILAAERRRGIVRVTFVCGLRAVGDYRRKHQWLTAAANVYSTDAAQVPVLAERNLAQVKELQRRIGDLTERLLAHEARALLANAPVANGARVVTHVGQDLDAAGLRTLATALVAEPGVVALLAGTAEGKTALVFARSADLPVHAGNLLRDALREFGGSGGGRPDFAQGGGTAPERAAELLVFAAAQIET